MMPSSHAVASTLGHRLPAVPRFPGAGWAASARSPDYRPASCRCPGLHRRSRRPAAGSSAPCRRPRSPRPADAASQVNAGDGAAVNDHQQPVAADLQASQRGLNEPLLVVSDHRFDGVTGGFQAAERLHPLNDAICPASASSNPSTHGVRASAGSAYDQRKDQQDNQKRFHNPRTLSQVFRRAVIPPRHAGNPSRCVTRARARSRSRPVPGPPASAPTASAASQSSA